MDHRIPHDAPRQRLSDYARTVFPHLTSGQGVRKAIKRGYILVDGAPATTGTWTAPGMVLTWHEPDYLGKILPLDLRVAYEDDHLAVVEKPAGLLTRGNQFRTLERALLHNLTRSPLPGSFAVPQPVHRLDLLTSGLVLIGKTYADHADLAQQFAERRVRKTYTALVHGEFPGHAVYEAPIADRTALTEAGSVQRFQTGPEEWLSLVHLLPRTGRKHQLRMHLSAAGFPIVGDPLYCPADQRVVRRGMFLNATKLAFAHPRSGQPLCVEMALPNKFLSYPRRKAARYG